MQMCLSPGRETENLFGVALLEEIAHTKACGLAWQYSLPIGISAHYIIKCNLSGIDITVWSGFVPFPVSILVMRPRLLAYVSLCADVNMARAPSREL